MIQIQAHSQSVRAALTALQQRFADLSPLLDVVGDAIVDRAKARFESSTAPDGSAWRPKKKPDGRKTLVGESGDLRRQITRQVHANVLSVTASAKYAAIHQFGGHIERAAYSKLVRHRTDAKGQLLRSAIMGGRGLVFAKDSHKRASQRWFEVPAHRITIAPRPFMPVTAAGELYPAETAAVLAQTQAWVLARSGGRG